MWILPALRRVNVAVPASFARAVLGFFPLAVMVTSAPGLVVTVIARETLGTARSLNVSSRAISTPLVSSATMVGAVVDSISVVALAAGVRVSPASSEIMAATTPVVRVCIAFSLRGLTYTCVVTTTRPS